MQVFLSHETALQILRSANLPSLKMDDRFEIPSNFVPEVSAEDARRLCETYNIVGTLTGCVKGNPSQRRWNRHLCSRMHSELLLSREYICLEPGVFVASPELTLAQVASRLASTDFSNAFWRSSFTPKVAPQVILSFLICEMCGEYVFDLRDPDGFRPRSPLTTIDKIKCFAEKTSRFRGKGALDAALASALPNSYSPAETNLALLEVFGPSVGGIGLAKHPRLNFQLTTHSAYGINQRRGDQMFPEDKILIEYNGGYHEGERANKDDSRRIELENAGFRVTVINKEELFSAKRLEWALSGVIKAVGRTGRRAKDYESRRADLRALLFELSNTKCWENRHMFVPAEYISPGARSSDRSYRERN